MDHDFILTLWMVISTILTLLLFFYINRKMEFYALIQEHDCQ